MNNFEQTPTTAVDTAPSTINKSENKIQLEEINREIGILTETLLNDNATPEEVRIAEEKVKELRDKRTKLQEEMYNVVTETKGEIEDPFAQELRRAGGLGNRI